MQFSGVHNTRITSHQFIILPFCYTRERSTFNRWDISISAIPAEIQYVRERTYEHHFLLGENFWVKAFASKEIWKAWLEHIGLG